MDMHWHFNLYNLEFHGIKTGFSTQLCFAWFSFSFFGLFFPKLQVKGIKISKTGVLCDLVILIQALMYSPVSKRGELQEVQLWKQAFSIRLAWWPYFLTKTTRKQITSLYKILGVLLVLQQNQRQIRNLKELLSTALLKDCRRNKQFIPAPMAVCFSNSNSLQELQNAAILIWTSVTNTVLKLKLLLLRKFHLFSLYRCFCSDKRVILVMLRSVKSKQHRDPASGQNSTWKERNYADHNKASTLYILVFLPPPPLTTSSEVVTISHISTRDKYALYKLREPKVSTYYQKQHLQPMPCTETYPVSVRLHRNISSCCTFDLWQHQPNLIDLHHYSPK